MLKKVLFVAAMALVTAVTPALAEEEGTSLDVFEQCNNWARHYCVNDLHAQAVDNKLLSMKNAGIPITLGKIKSIARQTRVPTSAPAEE